MTDHDKRTSSSARLPVILAVLLPVVGGCWPGHRMADRELVYRHPAVRWVWRTGGQLGAIYFVPSTWRNVVADLKTGEGCVILTEAGPGDIVWSPWRVTTAIRLDSGSPVFGRPLDKHEWTYLSWERSEADRRFVAPLTAELENVWENCSEHELYVRRTGSSGNGIKLLALRESERVGAVDHAVEFPENVIVVGTTRGYVLCIELDELRPRPSDTGSSLQP